MNHRASLALLGALLVIVSHPLAVVRAAETQVAKDMAMTMILAREEGSGPIAVAIGKLQDKVKASPHDARAIEQLGRYFIARARTNFDPGSYKLAEMCGTVLQQADAKNPQGLLLTGEAQLAMHRFHEAEGTARQLLTLRQEMADHALLGDALMEQGRLDEAVQSYQAMVDAKPCLPSYSRVAHMRWLTGDIEGAIDMAQQAIACGSYRDAEPMAWVTARLAFYQWQDGQLDRALATANRATEIVPGYPQALLVTGRILLAQGKPAEATAALDSAAQKLPLPEVLWALADAWRLQGNLGRAQAAEALLLKSGAAADPRSFALYLSTRNWQPKRAVALAAAELKTRSDVYSYDALAWAQQAAGWQEDALANMAKAMAGGNRDARLFLHAGLIAGAAGHAADATQWLGKAQAMRVALLPSELDALDAARRPFSEPSPRPDLPPKPVTTPTAP